MKLNSVAIYMFLKFEGCEVGEQVILHAAEYSRCVMSGGFLNFPSFFTFLYL
jgi:hypothetical protein